MTRTVTQSIRSLPEPGSEELAHSAQLAELIRQEILARGPMEFSRFMELALYAPGLGYYSAGRTQFGAKGDFITAPELGDVFARCLARACEPVLDELGPDASVFELGGGSGALCVDLLRAWAARDRVPSRYRILEPSASLRAQQRERVASALPSELAARVEWLDGPLEQAWEGIALANEVIDALPTFRFIRRADGVWSEHVQLSGQNAGDASEPSPFTICERPAEAWLAASVHHIERRLGRKFEAGYRSEVLPQLPAWIDAVVGTLRRGLALFVDYGYPRAEYYRPDRSDGTLVCHYRHHAHDDPMRWVGLQDITAFVDFTALAEACTGIGFDLVSWLPQSQFLLAAGLAEVLESKPPGDAASQYELAREVKRLMLPDAMGERFHVAAFARQVDIAQLSWARSDRSTLL